MAATTTNKTIANSSAMSSAEAILDALSQHQQELTWLAEFLTDDELLAFACVADACQLSHNNKGDEIYQACLHMCPRESTIRSAIDLKRAWIAELSSTYDSADCMPQKHPPLSSDEIELVVMESEGIRRGLDSLCRFVLVLCGVERYAIAEVASLLGITEHAVEVAYVCALEFLDVISCQTWLQAYDCAAA